MRDPEIADSLQRSVVKLFTVLRLQLHSGHGPLMPQQIDPQTSPPAGPGAAQMSPVPHADPCPHRHVPFVHRSPARQHTAPHAGPSGQPPVPPQNAGDASMPPSAHACFVHATPLAVHVHELQPSPFGNTSPNA